MLFILLCCLRCWLLFLENLIRGREIKGEKTDCERREIDGERGEVEMEMEREMERD